MREKTDARKIQNERIGKCSRSQRTANLSRAFDRDFADKFQGNVEIRDVRPPDIVRGRRRLDGAQG